MDQAEFEKQIEPFTFDLPDSLIARQPLGERDLSRLLVVDSASGKIFESSFRAIPDFFNSSDRLILNRTRVSFRRLALLRTDGKSFKPLFVAFENGIWRVMVYGAGKLREGQILAHATGEEFEIIGRIEEFVLLKPRNQRANREWEEFFEANGEVPLPPYMGRDDDSMDRTRYRTVFGNDPGSLAAPTAGLHFTQSLLDEIRRRGAQTLSLSLTIGTGTFAPLKPWNFERKALHTESYNIPETTAFELETPGRNIAVGTTSLRSLESNWRAFSRITAGEFSTDLFLFPPDRITSVQGLITNFHLPASSLFMLVCSFAGTELMQRAYAYAINHKFRFYSYGDAMLILPGI
ncbi:MAG: tRNA preQ1(34) S-adenosylmethionine ribosyltransferase-isomerase QueA [Spirochaetia bacterium]|nr:tRNA preQ1(34) S-adenosylmethionine ribosyltransferase-isomerase QueA [Spirochaetia bacterium]